jgi:hypothetical protein
MKSLLLITLVILCAAIPVFGQTNIVFTGIYPTTEQAIQLDWSSVPGEMYQVQYADELATNSDGSTDWQVLYDKYPSQGTNTFIGDFGNYSLSPQVVNPKYSSMRFYRILDEGHDSTADEPVVSISSVTNNQIVSGEVTITVTASTEQPVLSGTTLWVNGQEMPMTENTTNYVDSTGVTNFEVDTYTINTCEWGNSTNTIFATAENESGYGDAINSGAIASGHGVSPFVNVVFNNLVTKISFSQPSFDPTLGETQEVTAYCVLNCDWTLNITDINSNLVQSVSGVGNYIDYLWDGTGTGETNLPAGVYFYYITAATNGLANEVLTNSGGGGDGTNVLTLPSPDLMSDSLNDSSSDGSLWVVDTNTETVVPFLIYPPGYDTNGLTIIRATRHEIRELTSSSESSDSFSADDAPSGGGIGSPGFVTPLPDPQNTPPSPQRPPTNPVRGMQGTCGVVYDTYSGNGTNGFTVAPLDDGFGIGLDISLDSFPADDRLGYAPLPQYTAAANNFISNMGHWGWNNTINNFDSKLSTGYLTGSGTPLNNVNLAVLMTHGAYGNGEDGLDYYTDPPVYQMYYPITSGGGADYLSLSDMNLGGSGTGGLKWMAILACNSLQHHNWADMQEQGVVPYNSNLHLLLGVDTVTYASPTILWYWSEYMNYGTSTNANSYNPLTIRNAWYAAARAAFSKYTFPSAINFIVSGDSACANDMLQTNYTPEGVWFTDTPTQVYP